MSMLFSYPTAASPTTEKTIGNKEQLPYSRPHRAYQTAAETDSGVELVYNWGASMSRTFSTLLWPLTDTEKVDLENFFTLAEGSGGVNGRIGQWQLTDTNADVWTVRFAQDVFAPEEVSPTYWRLMLTMRVVG